MIFLVFTVILLTAFYFKRRVEVLYNQAKQKHRDEKLEMILFFGKSYLKTGIAIRRCYMPLFAFFQCKYTGITFEGVQVVVYDFNENILICERDDTRKQLSKLDIGAAGMIAYPHSPRQTAEEELYEELGIKASLGKFKTLYPCQGYRCIIHVYKCITKIDALKSIDGSYTNFGFMNKEQINEIIHDIKFDGQLMLRQFL
jgi:hypothetical protein